MSQSERASGRILVDSDGAIGRLTIDNISRHNAISMTMWRQLGEGIETLATNPKIRCVILSGAGDRAFASGADISEFDKARASSDAMGEYDAAAKGALQRLAGFGKPLIAAIRGYCLGGGLGLSLHADIRVAADEARFAIPAGRLGLGYDYAGLERLVGIVGPAAAKYIMFSAETFDAARALQLGVVTEVVPPADFDARVTALAARIASNAPLTVAAAKRSIDTMMSHPDEAAIAACRVQERACFDSADYAEGCRAFAEKRQPNFQGR